MTLKFSSFVCLFITGYVIFGLSLSAVEEVSKLGFVFAFLGLFLIFFYMIIMKERIPKFALPYMLFFIYLFLTYFWSPTEDTEPVFVILTTFLACLMISLSLHLNLISPKKLLIILILPGVLNFYAFVNGINYTSVIYDLFSDENAFKRFGGFVGHPNQMISRVMLCLFVAFIFIKDLYKDKSFNFIIFPFIVLLSIFAVYSSGSKKGLLFVFFALLAILLHYSLIRKMIVPIVISFFFLIIISFSVITQIDLYNSEYEVFVRIDGMLHGDESTTERFEMIFMGLGYFLQSPIFGNGLDSFSEMSGLGYYSHNNFIELLTNGGVVAVLLYYSIVCKAVKNYRLHNNLILTSLLLMLIISFDATGITYTDRALQIFMAIFFSVYYEKSRFCSV